MPDGQGVVDLDSSLGDLEVLLLQLCCELRDLGIELVSQLLVLPDGLIELNLTVELLLPFLDELLLNHRMLFGDLLKL